MKFKKIEIFLSKFITIARIHYLEDFDFNQNSIMKSSPLYVSCAFASTMPNVVINCNKYTSLMPCHILQYLWDSGPILLFNLFRTMKHMFFRCVLTWNLFYVLNYITQRMNAIWVVVNRLGPYSCIWIHSLTRTNTVKMHENI